MPFPGLAVLTVQTAREVKSRRLEQDVVVGSEIRKDSFWVFLRKRLDNCSRRRAGSSSSSVNKDWVSGRSMGELESLRGRGGGGGGREWQWRECLNMHIGWFKLAHILKTFTYTSL